MSDIAAGSIVVHLTHPEWGPGKVFCRDGGVALVGFRPPNQQDRVLRVEIDGFLASAAPGNYLDLTSWDVPADENCHQVKTAGVGKVKKPAAPLVAKWTNDQAYERFLGYYPKGFADPKYAELERGWKWVQHGLWLELLPGNTLRSLAGTDPAAAAKSVMRVVQTAEKPLLYPRGEIPVMSGALKTPQATVYFNALANFLGAPTPARGPFEAMVDALTSLPTRNRIGTWPIATVVPFLARPDRHMFVKPAPTKEAARRLGVDLLYSPQLKWATYERVLDWSHRLLGYLRPRGAVDMIDVQSFIWTIVR